MNLYEAIFARYSVRKYRMTPVEDKILSGLWSYLDEIQPLFPEIKTSVHILPEPGQKVKLSGWPNVSAPHYLVLYSEETERSARNAGYLMQMLCLYLTSRGVGCCYQGMAGKKDKALEEEGLSCAMVMAFGYPKNPGKKPEAKRLSMEQLCVVKNEPKAHVRELLEAARLAPSALNAQPWRFVVYENRFHIFAPEERGRRLGKRYEEFDFGVLLANIMAAAEVLWIDVDLIRLENIEHRNLPKHRYITSILLR